LSRTGRPQKASKRDIQKLKQYAQLYPKHTYQQIRDNVVPFLSPRTVRRILNSFDIRKWQCKKRPELNTETVRKRYKWVQYRKDWSVDEWATIIFSDEISVERGAGGQREWAFRTVEQKWLP
jgi:Transposase